jgi:XTP/dITP diphosphohydrolase
MPKQKSLLYATTNPSKLARMQDILKGLPLEISSLQGFTGAVQIQEDGSTPESNAIKKARYHFKRAGMPTLAVDSGLTINRFPPHKQPGMFVRRIYGADQEVSDEDMLAYYIRELQAVGGQSKGVWITSVALMTSSDKNFSTTMTSRTMFVAKRSPIVMLGEPLNSLQIDPLSGTYFSEMTAAQRVSAQRKRASGILGFIQGHWHEI